MEGGATVIVLHLPYPVSANRYWRHASIGGRARMFLSSEAKQYRQAVRSAAIAAKLIEPLIGYLEVRYTLQPRTNLDGSASRTRIDLGNAEKVASDALNGVAWYDDSQLVRIVLEIGDPVAGGGLIVEVGRAET